jgi:thiosulfate/3-mercaptopyruvate sulfurtransferase
MQVTVMAWARARMRDPCIATAAAGRVPRGPLRAPSRPPNRKEGIMPHRTIRWIAIVPALFAIQVYAQAGEIVDTAYVANALRNGAIVWDVRDADSYKEGHIAGAVNAGDIGVVLRDPNKEDWLAVSQIETVLGNAGIDLANREVIAYSRLGDPYAYFGLSTLRYFGAKAPKVYHGGLDAWKTAGMPVSTEPTKLPPVALKLVPQKNVVVWTDEMVQKVAEAKAGRVQIVDARTPKEYAGEDIRAIRGGHIPGAVNVPYEQNWVDPATGAKLARKEVKTRDGMALKSRADLQKLYANLDPDKETIVYCQSGVRGAEAATVLRELGFKDVKIYEPSWLVYAGTLSAPANNETFVNVGALTSRIGSLQSRIDELEKELAALKKGK